MTALIRSLNQIRAEQRGCVVTIGNLDGIHLGHQALVSRVVDKARQLNRPSLIITFEPHPFEFFAKNNLQIPRLTRFREKFTHLQVLGVDNILLLPFNQDVAGISASDFVTEILYYGLGAKCIIIGDDFHFGFKRQGNIDLLKSMSELCGFTVEAMPTVLVEGERVSSTRVRKALNRGDLKEARFLLGRGYAMQGRVRHGDKMGREWGFPTANIFLHRRLTPITGVFTVSVHGITHNPIPGVANVGIRPTVGGTRTLLEVYLLDFNQMIYGRYVEVEFCEKLREEIHYENVDLLKQQIAKDVIAAKLYFEERKIKEKQYA